jgi:hypothetical protein
MLGVIAVFEAAYNISVNFHTFMRVVAVLRMEKGCAKRGL